PSYRASTGIFTNTVQASWAYASCPTRGMAFRWNRARAAFIASGIDVTQNGDTEGCATFDPENATRAKIAMLHAKVKMKRQVSPERREAMIANLARARQDRQSISLV